MFIDLAWIMFANFPHPQQLSKGQKATLKYQIQVVSLVSCDESLVWFGLIFGICLFLLGNYFWGGRSRGLEGLCKKHVD